jgi:hypothetical protein
MMFTLLLASVLTLACGTPGSTVNSGTTQRADFQERDEFNLQRVGQYPIDAQLSLDKFVRLISPAKTQRRKGAKKTRKKRGSAFGAFAGETSLH